MGSGRRGGVSNPLLNDYQFVSYGFAPYTGMISIEGLVADADYLLYVYSAGDTEGQGGAIELNGVTGLTNGAQLPTFVEDENFTIMEVKANSSGVISGSFEPFNSFSSGVINGLQITPTTIVARVLDFSGAESPTVHSPGDPVTVVARFNEEVTLDQAQQLQVEIDVDGTVVTATHFGATVGKELTLRAPALPSATTMQTKVVANSLQLTGGATLVDEDGIAVVLGHAETALPNDQVSATRFSVYPFVTGLAQSPHYRFRVREVGSPTWSSAFAWFTKCDDDIPGQQATNGYYGDQIGGWSHTYANFEMANHVPLEVEIQRLDPVSGTQIDIQTAVPHPRRRVKSFRVENGRAIVTIDQPALFAVDIDGELDTLDLNQTPYGAGNTTNEDAIHTVSVFANPFILDKPSASDPGVCAVSPTATQPPPSDGLCPATGQPWTTLLFEPGVHQIFDGTWDIGERFRLRSDRSYYIPGDALVHGNMTNDDDDSDGNNIRIFGHGTLSGERIPHFPNDDDSFHDNKPIRIVGKAKGSRIEGITVADSANHSVAIKGIFNIDPADYNYVRWTKVITWRANGDGISPNGTGYLEDSFLRTQDDGTYIGGLGIRRNVYWHDVNGMPLRSSNMLQDTTAIYGESFLGKLFVEDNDVIYARGAFRDPAPDHSIFGFPSPNPNNVPLNDGSHVVFRDINVEDPLPTRQLFGWDLTSDGGGNFPISGSTFQNIVATAAANIDGDPDVFFGNPTPDPPGPPVLITGLIFDDVTAAGEHYGDIADFSTMNASGFVFGGTADQTTTYQNADGGKWYFKGDWSAEVEPANNDTVNHTSEGSALVVDAHAYAKIVNVGHPSTARVVLESGGRLTITDELALGAAGPGELRLLEGTVTLLDAQPGALDVTPGSGELYLEKGTLEWAGDHVSDIQTLFAAGDLSFDNGRAETLTGGGTLIGQSSGNELYASFDDPAVGSTTVWVVPEPTGIIGLASGVLTLAALSRTRRNLRG